MNLRKTNERCIVFQNKQLDAFEQIAAVQTPLALSYINQYKNGKGNTCLHP